MKVLGVEVPPAQVEKEPVLDVPSIDMTDDATPECSQGNPTQSLLQGRVFAAEDQAVASQAVSSLEDSGRASVSSCSQGGCTQAHPRRLCRQGDVRGGPGAAQAGEEQDWSL